MKKIAIIALVGAFLYGCGSSKTLFTADTVAIKASMDLNQVVDDKVWVEVDPGNLAPGPTSFFIPKTVPGTYSSDNYGKYIEGFKAFDGKGNELAFEKTDDNTWVIADGGNLD
ncbi:MAG: peptidase M61, partial [Flavobacteriaceae bacterium]